VAERISDAEHSVMEVLWDESPLSAQDVAERVDPARGWSANTVKTLLGRLIAKSRSRMRRMAGATSIVRPSRAVIMSRANRGG